MVKSPTFATIFRTTKQSGTTSNNYNNYFDWLFDKLQVLEGKKFEKMFGTTKTTLVPLNFCHELE